MHFDSEEPSGLKGAWGLRMLLEGGEIWILCEGGRLWGPLLGRDSRCEGGTSLT